MAKKLEEIKEEECPYELPKGWKWERLGNIAEVVSGGTPSSKVKEYYNGDIAWITPADLSGYKKRYISHGAKNITKTGLDRSSAKLVPKDTVLLSSRAPIGYVVIAKNELSTNQGFKNFLPSDDYLPQYLYWYLKGNKELLESYASGTTFLELSASKAKMIEFPLAPKKTQQKIVDIIESLFAKLDIAQEKVEQVLAESENRRSAILHKAFSGELTEKWREENNVSFDTWENIPLGKITDICSSKRVYKDDYVSEGIPFFRSTEIVELCNNNETVASYFITEDKYNDIKDKYGVPKEGDLLVTSVGTIGKTWIVDDRKFYYKDGNLTQVKKCDSLDMKYLERFIQSNFFINQVMDTVSGSAYNALTIVKFKKIMIKLPIISEQKEIICLLDKFLSVEDKVKSTCQSTLESIATMRKSILAKAFRGELYS